MARARPTKAGHLSGDIVISLSGAVYGTFATETIQLSGMGTANSIGWPWASRMMCGSLIAPWR